MASIKFPLGWRRIPTVQYFSFSYWSGYKLHIITSVTCDQRYETQRWPRSGWWIKTSDSSFPVRCRSELSGITKTFAHARKASIPRLPHPIAMHTYDRFTNEFSRKMTWTTTQLGGTAVAQWLRCCATNRKVAGATGIFHWHKILPIALWPWGRLSL